MTNLRFWILKIRQLVQKLANLIFKNKSNIAKTVDSAENDRFFCKKIESQDKKFHNFWTNWRFLKMS